MSPLLHSKYRKLYIRVVCSTTLIMKQKISVTVDENNLFRIRESMTIHRHKNKSQAVEFFLKNLFGE